MQKQAQHNKTADQDQVKPVAQDIKVFPLLPKEVLVRQRELSQMPTPPGWPLRETDDHAAPRASRAGTGSVTVKVREALDPYGWRKKLRFAVGFWNMLRRPTVMRTYPIHLQLESTDACNLNCTTCSRDVIVRKASMLDDQLWKKIIDEMKPTNINVSGIGEPFLHPHIYEIIEYAKENGAAVNCATNFTRIHDNHRRLVECGIDQCKVSIDATDAETFRLIRGEDSWQEIVDNIKAVNHWKQKLGRKTPSIRFNFALQRFNYLQVVELVELARALSVDGIYYQFLSYVDMEDRKGMLTGDMSKEKLRELLDEADRRAKEYGIQTNLDLWQRDFELFWNRMQPIDEYQGCKKNCYMPWISTWLGADGWIRPCPIMPWTLDEGRMGHLGEQSLEEIWNGPKYRELREALARGERPTRSCKTCYPQDLYNVVSIKSKLLP
jgi:MoaA/NifB/PqqE/SkfB family radical SAM enzyme